MPRLPAATSPSRSRRARKLFENEPQWSKSTARRSFSAARAAAAPVGAVADPLVPGLEPVEAGGEEPGHRRRDQQVVEVALGLVDDPAPTPRRRPSAGRPRSSTRPGARVDEDRPRPAEVAAEAPAHARRRSIRSARPRRRAPRRRAGCRAPAGRSRLRRAPPARGCRCAGRSSSWRCSRSRAGAHQDRSRISSTQEWEMFQSSDMSWSSQSIEVETLASSSHGSAARSSSPGRARCTPRSR